MDGRALVDYAKTLDCIHCGLCLRTCPTYQLSGVESASPRGRVHLMRAVAEGELAPDAAFADEMDFCLLCRNCESVCPSGVHFGRMMEFTRGALQESGLRPWWSRAAHRLGFRVVLVSRPALAVAATLLRLVQRTGLARACGPWFGERGRSLASLPPVPPARERGPLPARTPARGARRGAVAVLEGCVMPALFGRVNRATVRVLAAAGRDVSCPPQPACCGSLHAHNGDLKGARRLARETIAAFEALAPQDGRPLDVVLNSAGCSAHMKEYGELLADDSAWSARAAAFAERVFDFSEYLVANCSDALPARLDGARALAGPLTWDDPCHLCHGQGVREEPRELLARLDGVERVELDESESCCGSAGIYSLLRPRDSAAILAPRLEALRRTGARTLVTANPGCHLQWQSGILRAGLPVEVLHIAEVLDLALAARE